MSFVTEPGPTLDIVGQPTLRDSRQAVRAVGKLPGMKKRRRARSIRQAMVVIPVCLLLSVVTTATGSDPLVVVAAAVLGWLYGTMSAVIEISSTAPDPLGWRVDGRGVEVHTNAGLVQTVGWSGMHLIVDQKTAVGAVGDRLVLLIPTRFCSDGGASLAQLAQSGGATVVTS